MYKYITKRCMCAAKNILPVILLKSTILLEQASTRFGKSYTVEHGLTTALLLQPLFCAPNELKVQSFPSVNSFTTSLIRPHRGPKVVVLTGFNCTYIYLLMYMLFLIFLIQRLIDPIPEWGYVQRLLEIPQKRF